jgi:diaminohydroxyphosphoribosylaminopyrimidine deaminase/5-amino-6-(5-phosphoribosylamino)uracil reductase
MRSWPSDTHLHCADPPDVGRLLASLGDAARAARFEVAPNPCVGAALLDADGNELARGIHEHWGGPHAEVRAMEAAREAGIEPERWHTLVVTLEPCSSHGKTPPCTEAILAAGLRRVVVGALDPDPRHRGRGLEQLAASGVDVQLEPGAAPLARVSPHFQRWTEYERLRRPRPWLIAKWAQTLTGQLTPPEDIGDGRWISGSAALNEVQELRSRVDAILTGVGTVLADNPRLTLRTGADPGAEPPMRVVLDTELRTPPEARILAPDGPDERGGPVYLLCRAGASPVRHRELLAAGARVHGLRPNAAGHVSLREVLSWCWRFGARRALLETGPTLLRAAFEARFVDQLRVITGYVRGGRGESMAPVLDRFSMEERLDREVGGDAVLEAFPRPR